jgi:hypothetical protein
MLSSFSAAASCQLKERYDASEGATPPTASWLIGQPATQAFNTEGWLNT